MNIAIFKEITTEEVLQELEAQGEKYTGLFVDMDNAEERKYVKDAASKISGMLKTLDRARIDKARDFKVAVEQEAAAIKTRLEAANEPYTLLIDAHKEKRAAILAEKKAREDAAEMLIKIAEDHDSAIMEDKVREFEKAEAVRLQKERDDQIAIEAAERATREAEERASRQVAEAKSAAERAEREKAEAVQAAEAKAQREAKSLEDARIAEQARIEAEQAAREADKNHRGKINREALAAFVAGGMDQDTAKLAVTLIAGGKIDHTQIKY